MTSHFPKPFDISLYLVLDPSFCQYHNPLVVLASALKGGVSMVQYRSKTTQPNIELIQACQKLCQEHHTPFILNDDPKLALDLHADGCHVGNDDTPAHTARSILGSDKILGVTVRTKEDKENAIKLATAGICNYAGIGAIFPSSSKNANPDAMLGLEGLAAYVDSFQSRLSTKLPLCAISGITAQNAKSVQATGVDGIAMIGAICGAKDPLCATKALRQQLQKETTS